MATPSTIFDADSQLHVRRLVKTSKRKHGVPLAPEFFRTTGEGRPPLGMLLAGGQGGEVRLKLYLTLRLLATAAPYKIEGYSAFYFARALGLPDPQKGGARRVSQALRWLADHDLVELDSGSGRLSTITVLSSSGSGDASDDRSGRWVTIPTEAWEEGWVHRLSGSGLAIMLCIFEAASGRGPSCTIPGDRRRQYGLAQDTWRRGADELESQGLLRTERVRDSGDYGGRGMIRERIQYTLSAPFETKARKQALIP